MRKATFRTLAIGVALAVVTAGVATAAAMKLDVGQENQKQLADKADKLFGVKEPIAASSTTDSMQPRRSRIRRPSSLWPRA